MRHLIERVWEEPAVYRIPVELPENPLRTLNSYVIKTPGGNLVIDTGFRRPECRASLWRGLEELNLDLGKTALFLTHLHADHTGLAEDFVARGVPVYMGSIDYAYFLDTISGKIWAPMEELYRREGYPEGEMLRQAGENHARIYGPEHAFPVRQLEDGDVFRVGDVELRAVCTPGHTPGHMALYLPAQQVLFSGDHVLFDITPNIGMWTGMEDALADYLDSLDKVRSLPVRQTFPGHRGQKGELHQRLDSLKAHHRQRLEEIAGAVAAAPGSNAYQIAGKITWSARGLGWEQFPPQPEVVCRLRDPDPSGLSDPPGTDSQTGDGCGLCLRPGVSRAGRRILQLGF